QDGDVRQEETTNDTTEERCGFDRCHPSNRGPAFQSCADQKAAEREALRNFVDAQSREQRPLCSTGRRCFALDCQSQTVGRTVNCQGDYQCGSDFAEMSRGIGVEMTGRTSRANVLNMFADEKEKRVAAE